MRSNLPLNYVETEKRIKEMKWEKERTTGDMEREQGLLDYTKQCFEIKKQELLKFLAESSSSYATQVISLSIYGLALSNFLLMELVSTFRILPMVAEWNM